VVLIAEYNGISAGYLVGEYQNDKTFHILSFGVHESYRNKHIGTSIIECLENIVKEYCTDLTLYVHVENNKGICFYEKNGFHKERLLRNYYKGSIQNVQSYDSYKMAKYIGPKYIDYQTGLQH
jgi:ribosomal protein S18 acetylase RimI-like enzyme